MTAELMSHGAFHLRRYLDGDTEHRAGAFYPDVCTCGHTPMTEAQPESPALKVQRALGREAETAKLDAAWEAHMAPIRIAAGSVR